MKKCGPLKIIHEKWKVNRKNPDNVIKEFQGSLEIAMEHNKDIEALLPKAQVISGLEEKQKRARSRVCMCVQACVYVCANVYMYLGRLFFQP